MNRPRLDQYLYHTSFFASRAEAQSFINSGFVILNDRVAKPSSPVKNDDVIKIINDDVYLVIKAQINIENNICYVGYEVIQKGKINKASC